MKFPYYKLLFAALLHSFLTSFQFGFQNSVLNQPASIFKAFINETYTERSGSSLDVYGLDLLWGFTVAGQQIGAVIGCWCTQYLAESLGRKWSLFIVNNVIAIIGSLIFSFAQVARSFEMLIAGRILVGVSAGLGSGLLALYLSEISPKQFRGLIGSFQNGFVTMCTLIGQIMTLPQVLGTENLWRFLVGLGIVPAVVQIAISWWFPESPKYLLLKRRNENLASSALVYFNGPKVDVETFYKEFRQEEELAKESIGLIGVFRTPSLRNPVLMSVVVMLAFIFTGIMIISGFSTTIFVEIGIEESTAKTCSLIMSISTAIGAVVAVPMIERFNRRPLLIGCTFACVICDVIFLIFSQIGQHVAGDWLLFVAVVAIVALVCVFNIGPGPIGWFISSEVTPQNARSIGASLSITSNWLCSLVVFFAFPPLLEAINTWVFVLFIVPCMICIIWLWYKMPETKDRSVDEIMKKWQEK